MNDSPKDSTNKSPERVTNKIIVESPSTPLVLESQFISRLVGVTPNVKNIQYAYSHVGATTVTNFLHGQDGQELAILGNGNTTITHGTNIFTNTGANKVLATNKVYVFYFFGTKWYEGA